ncbi:SDR family NAD(P)-dependent oxidoreductase [Candidatus Aerophobetes bacterium]|nr:SDR family NAD(P)-dependent oxidoreductase [Candidatus Aerophobetes bacterium]
MNNGFLNIREVCQKIGIKEYTLRYWEKEFNDFLQPYRSKGGHRRYDKNDLRNALEIKRLIKNEGYTIKGAKKILESNQENLASRKSKNFPQNNDYKYFKGKRILITGGTGTIGKEIVRQLLPLDPMVIRIYSRDETKQFNMQEEFKDEKNLRYFIGDVRDAKRLEMAMEDVDIVFHTAALKHVASCEYNPFEAVNTNVYGSQNVIKAALKVDVEKVIFTSTDKAVNPTSTMGATKLMAEKLFTSANHYKGKRRVIFASVRFGNVLGSRGSVIPLFKEQLIKGKSITITSKKMTRFIMFLREAAEFIFKATLLAKGGEIFVMKMSVIKILDLVEAIENSLGFHNNIKEVGIKPGEKIYEELMTKDEERRALERDDMYIILPAIGKNVRHSYPGSYIPENNGHYISAKIPSLTQEEIKKFLIRENLIK